MNRRAWLRPMSAGLVTSSWSLESKAVAQEPSYRSPYSVKFRQPVADLEVGFDQAPWNNPHLESDLPAPDWYSPRHERKLGAWGPRARQYPPAPGLPRRSAAWMQDRLILTATRWIGYPYQHHHIPDWDPPAGWPWHKVAYGRNSKGIDCSNFSSFYFNYGLGLKLDTGIRQQAQRREVRGPGGSGILTIQTIERAPYDTLIARLEPADLLYIRNDTGRIAHVILWLGAVGVSPDHIPLVLDATGGNHKDSNGVRIPSGVQVRPFFAKSWYAQNFAHAHRIIHGIPSIRAGEVPEAEEGGAIDT